MSTAAALLVLALVSAPAAGAAIPRRDGARPAAAGLRISTQPALQPAFNPGVTNYAMRCAPADEATVTVDDPGRTPVSVDRQPTQRRSFQTSLRVGGSQSFSVRTGPRSHRSRFTVRCLPAGFPRYTVQLSGQPQAAYYLLTPTTADSTAPEEPYVVLFDRHGVPVWWYEDSTGVPIDAGLLADGNLSWYVVKNLFAPHTLTALNFQTASEFGVPQEVQLVEHSLDGRAVGKPLSTAGTPTDFHEGLQLADGDTLMTSYTPRANANLAPVFGFGTALDAAFQEIRPDGSVAFAWDANGRIGPAESARWPLALDFGYPHLTGLIWDYQHIDSIAPDGDGFLISLAHTDAVYLVNGTTGAIEWKLGGTTTPESLRIIGDPDAKTDFGGQYDARVWPDGSVSVLDDGTDRGRSPRVVRFVIDAQARTATLVQMLTDPTPSTSACCGSARLLPGGDWVVGWGSTQNIDEVTPADQPVLALRLAAPYYSYRALPILPGQLRAGVLQAAMSKLNPRTPSGLRPPDLSKLRVRYRQRQLRIRFQLSWPASVRIAVAAARSGRAVGWRCLPAAGRRPRHPCTDFVSLGTGVEVSSRYGANHLSLPGRIAGRTLTPGSYRVSARPLLDGRIGAAVIASFRVRR